MKAVVVLLALIVWLPSPLTAQDVPPEKLKYQADMPEGGALIGAVEKITLINGTVFTQPAMIYAVDDETITFRVPPKIKGFRVPWSEIKYPNRKQLPSEMAAYAEDQAKKTAAHNTIIASYKPGEAGYYMYNRAKDFDGKQVILNCSSVQEVKTLEKKQYIDFIAITPGSGNTSTMTVRVPAEMADALKAEYGTSHSNKITRPLSVIFSKEGKGSYVVFAR